MTPKPPLTSKPFEYKGVVYHFELSEDVQDVSFTIYFDFPGHQPVCENNEHGRVPSQYSTTNYLQTGRSGVTDQTIDDYIIKSHKMARASIDRVKALEEKMNLDFHLLAAQVDDVK